MSQAYVYNLPCNALKQLRTVRNWLVKTCPIQPLVYTSDTPRQHASWHSNCMHSIRWWTPESLQLLSTVLLHQGGSLGIRKRMSFSPLLTFFFLEIRVTSGILSRKQGWTGVLSQEMKMNKPGFRSFFVQNWASDYQCFFGGIKMKKPGFGSFFAQNWASDCVSLWTSHLARLTNRQMALSNASWQ